MSNIIDGRKLAMEHQLKVKEKLTKLKIKPKAVSILIGDDPPSILYTNMKQKKAREVGIDFEPIRLPEMASIVEIKKQIEKLNNDPKITGIMIQLPLPKKYFSFPDTMYLINLIAPKKDVDGLTNRGFFIPATTRSVLELLDSINISYTEKLFTVLGAKGVVGASIVQELQKKQAQVIPMDKRDTNFSLDNLKIADVIISAVGVPNLIKGDMIKKGAVVIDVGIMVVDDFSNKINGKIVGDVDFESVSLKASKITPVPGGVGPMTVICLMENVADAAVRIVQDNL